MDSAETLPPYAQRHSYLCPELNIAVCNMQGVVMDMCLCHHAPTLYLLSSLVLATVAYRLQARTAFSS
jgi:hypothetical protein